MEKELTDPKVKLKVEALTFMVAKGSELDEILFVKSLKQPVVGALYIVRKLDL